MFRLRSVNFFAAGVILGSVALTACTGQAGRSPAAATSIPADSIIAGNRVDFAHCLQAAGTDGCFNTTAVLAATTGAPVVAPGAPSGLTGSGVGGVVLLSWSPGPGDAATGYVIEAGSASGLANLANFNTGNSLTTFSASGVGAGTYFVRIRASNSAGVSGPSNEFVLVVTATSPGGCAGPPTALTLNSQSAGSISFSWAGSPSATSYQIEAGSSPGLSNLANFDTGNPLTSFSAGGIGAGSYYVRVRARSACGVSAPSNEILIFVVGFTGDVQVSVAWNTPSDVDLHVVDPFGEEIFYGNTVSSSGGQLDVDSNPACSIDGRQIENIRWGSRAPGGTYTVRVDYWDACGNPQTNYTVTVKNGPSTSTFTGSLTGAGDHGFAGSGVFITSFSHASSLTEAPLMFRAPMLSTPSSEKLRRAAGR